jgi:hypothetical protein
MDIQDFQQVFLSAIIELTDETLCVIKKTLKKSRGFSFGLGGFRIGVFYRHFNYRRALPAGLLPLSVVWTFEVGIRRPPNIATAVCP